MINGRRWKAETEFMPATVARPISSPTLRRFLIGLLVIATFSLMVTSVFLSVMRDRYGIEVQRMRREVVTLRSSVRDLEGRKATLTTLSSIERKAKSMGMIYPRNAPRTLTVRVPKGEIPLTWQDRSPIPREPERIGGSLQASIVRTSYREGP